MNARVLILQLDGKIPNLALMRISAHHKAMGHDVLFDRSGNPAAVRKGLFDQYDEVYASAIFERTRDLCWKLLESYPLAHIGGSAWEPTLKLEDVGVTTRTLDYSPYPWFRHSLGFTQRGCRLKCPFCVVPVSEGGMREVATVGEVWRGEPWPKELLLLDNDFFGQPNWRQRIREIRDGDFKVCWNQGINVRVIGEEEAAAVASVKYRDDQFRTSRLYTAWDNRKDEDRLFRGLSLLKAAGVKPDHVLVYMLVGYWPGETEEDRLYRHARLREFGCRPYPMPYERTRELVGFQRWVVGAYDKRVGWEKWKKADYDPRKIA
jgi:hypothetical protein